MRYYVETTPCYPASFKVRSDRDSDNATYNYFRTRKEAQNEADRRNHYQALKHAQNASKQQTEGV
jgi:hypothetical protein